MTHSVRIFTGRAIFGLPSRSEADNHQDARSFSLYMQTTKEYFPA